MESGLSLGHIFLLYRQGLDDAFGFIREVNFLKH